jgi:hypothetical protein
MPACFTDPGNGEGVKLAMHGAFMAFATILGVYNAVAWCKRREPHHAFNAAVYGFLVAWEGHHVVHHKKRAS